MMPSSRAYSVGCTYTVNRLGASVEYFSGSRFFRMLSTTASMRSRAGRADGLAADRIQLGRSHGMSSMSATMCQTPVRSSCGFPGFCSLRSTVRVRFADFTLDSATRQLLHRGRGEIRLSPKAFDLLAALIEQRPTVLDKADLHRRIWPDTYVVDANLNVLIAEIRRALEDSRHRREVHPHRSCDWLCILRRGRGADRSLSARKAPPVRFWLVWNDRVIVLEDGDNTVGRDPECTRLAGCVRRVASSCPSQNRPRRRRGSSSGSRAARTARSSKTRRSPARCG